MSEGASANPEGLLIHALDLPPLYSRPSATTLLDVLGQLALRPASFERRDVKDNGTALAISDGIPRYLTTVIGSPLSWIEDDNLKEIVWETAGARLSERAGRTAMPSVDRTFEIPLLDCGKSISITLREPSLTADNLGHKTWAASYLLARQLPHLRSLLPCPKQTEMTVKEELPLRVLELGSGTGLVGIAAATVWASQVDLTDLPEIRNNLAYNCEQNKAVISAYGGSASARPLDWSKLPRAEQLSRCDRYDIVLASDPLYSPLHPVLVANAIERYIRREPQARVIVELPLREAYQPEIHEFKQRMETNGFLLILQGEEIGYDDWEGGDLAVECWWGIWGWREFEGEAR